MSSTDPNASQGAALEKAAQRKRSLLLVTASTVAMAAGQMLMKTGSKALAANTSLLAGVWDTAIHILTDPALFFGYAFYGLSAVLLVLALRHGELSMLYPLIALNYVWVTVLSVIFFHDSVTVLKVAGILVIVTGVAIMGRGAESKPA